MATWAFICKHCQWVFTYSKIGESLTDFIAAEKPKLPPDGVECICPHCKIVGTYRRHELIYQKSTLARR
jgi:rubredoxin